VISGEVEAVQGAVGELGVQGVSCRLLPVNYAFHSPQMDGLAEELIATLGKVRTGASQVAIYSTMSGQTAAAGDYEAAYWGRQMCTTVRFKEAVAAAAKLGHVSYIEVGPHPVLGAAVRQIVGAAAVVVGSLRRSMSESEQLLGGLSQLYVSGCMPNWRQVNQGGRSVELPTYAWQRQRYFFEGHITAHRNDARKETLEQKIPTPRTNQSTHPLLGRCLKSSVHPETYFWAADLNTELVPYLADHRVCGNVIFPAAAYVEMALAAANELFGTGTHVIEKIEFERALIVPERSTLQLQLVATRDEFQQVSFQFLSQPGNQHGQHGQHGQPHEATLHARGKMRNGSAASSHPNDAVALEVVRQRCAEPVSRTDFYDAMDRRGLQYGCSFQGVEQLWRGDHEAIARLDLTETVRAEAGDYLVHPALLDACFQVLAGILPGPQNGAAGTYVPVGIDRIQFHDDPHAGCWGHVRLESSAPAVNGKRGSQSDQPLGATGNGKGVLSGDISLFDEAGNRVVTIEGLRAHKVQGALLGGGEVTSEDVSDWFYELRWEPRAASVEPEAVAGSNGIGKWLIFADGAGAGEALRTELALLGESSIVVTAADSYSRGDTGDYQINPSAPQDLRQVLHEGFIKERIACRGVVHLWATDVVRPEGTTIESLKLAEELGPLSVLYLIQGLAKAAFRQAPQLWLVTRGAQYTGPEDEQLSIGQSALWGLGRTIRHEHPELKCRLVDLDGANRNSLGEARALCDLLRHKQGETQFAVRGKRLYAGRVAHLEAHTPNEATQSGVPIRADASYLITGGAGGLGLSVAAWMTEKGARHLVLLGRSAASPEAQQKINVMEGSGARVMLFQGDVTREEDLRAVLARMALEMPPLRGVVHAAGRLDDGILLQMDQQRFSQVTAPKIAGAWNLHRATLGAPLDFFILFSSLASLVGSPGQGSYAAGNAFLDGLARHRRLNQLPALSINWGPWAEVGMAAGQDRGDEQFALSGLKRLAPEQGIRVLERLLDAVPAQVGVMPLTAAGQRAFAVFAGEATAPLENQLPEKSPAGIRRRLEEAAPRERIALLGDHVRSTVAGVLGQAQADQLDPHRGLFEMGMDSLMAIEVSRSLQTSLEESFPLTSVFDHPTIESLARHLAVTVLELETSTPEQSARDDSGRSALRQQLEELSEDEALRLLTEQLSLTEVSDE
jgi:acyl transferase domain-containing protein